MRLRLSKICVILIAFVLVIYINLRIFSAIERKGKNKNISNSQEYRFDFEFMKNYLEDTIIYNFNRARGRTKRPKNIHLLNETFISSTKSEKPKGCKLLELLPLESHSFNQRENYDQFASSKACDVKKFGRIYDGILHLKLKNVQKVWLYYIREQGKKAVLSARHTLFSNSNSKVDNNLRNMLLGKECWNGCLSKGGRCPNFCGKDAFCCRKGFTGCPSDVIEVKSLSMFHSCTFSFAKFSLKNAIIKHKLKESFFKLELLIDNKFYEEFHVDFSLKQQSHRRANHHHHQKQKQKQHQFQNKLQQQKQQKQQQQQQQQQQKRQNISPSRYKRSTNFTYSHRLTTTTLTNLTTTRKAKKNEAMDPTKLQLNVQPPNILLIVVDHLSYKEYVNKLKHFHLLATTRRNTFIFKGFSHISENIATQLNVMLAGKKSLGNDGYSEIFQHLQKEGYKTFFSENDQEVDLNQRKFRKNLVTYDLQPWWQAFKKAINIKKNPGCLLLYGFDHLKQFFHSKKLPGKKFAFLRTSLLSHPQADLVIDKKFVDLINSFSSSGVINNTVLMFLGTHSPNTQYKLNDKVSFLSLSIPPYFKFEKKLMKNLHNNLKILTSTFDIPATLKHLTSWPRIKPSGGVPKYGSSLFGNLSELNRNCEDAGIEKQVCPCLT